MDFPTLWFIARHRSYWFSMRSSQWSLQLQHWTQKMDVDGFYATLMRSSCFCMVTKDGSILLISSSLILLICLSELLKSGKWIGLRISSPGRAPSVERRKQWWRRNEEREPSLLICHFFLHLAHHTFTSGRDYLLELFEMLERLEMENLKLIWRT